jgi:putative SOS response-associated peptidase YedK
LWERWKGGGQIIESNTIMVTDAVQVLSETHDRMPVILNAETARRWMSSERTRPGRIEDVAATPSSGGFGLVQSEHAVKARTEAPELIAAME